MGNTTIEKSNTEDIEESETGLTFERHFATDGVMPFDQIDWKRFDAVIADAKGNTVFEQKNVGAPASWSQTAVNIVASKYFHGAGQDRESSVRELISRVVRTIVDSGRKRGYFMIEEDAEAFRDDLTFLLVNQCAAFNSPVWFNVGVDRLEPESRNASWHWDAAKSAIVRERDGYRHPQCSACFINSVEDSLESILDLAKTEGMLFKFGSGTGTNLSVIRGSKEGLEGGGTASGPLSFMKGYDAFAGVIKSGGKTRRAAKMVILNADHPDIEEFIACKGKEEAKAHTLAANGYDASGPDSEAYSSIFFQNANNSVRVTDEFMRAVEADGDWNLTARRDGSVVKTVKAKDLLHQIAEQTWRCGDPGMQFDTTINRWHTSKASGRIDASNPCSEYMFLSDSACNLASLNLVKFVNENGTFDTDDFRNAVRTLIVAQDILVELAGYPTETISRNSHDYRPLGLGYANLGALLLALGLPYDSKEGRDYAAAVTALMGGVAYRVSAEMAGRLDRLGSDSGFDCCDGSFPGFWANAESFHKVMGLHHESARLLVAQSSGNAQGIARVAEQEWYEVADLHESFRNAQVTVLAPTGTIGFMMDCDTTGIEPMLGLVAWKKLVGGGLMKLVTNGVPRALTRLGYGVDETNAITAFIDEHGTIEGAPGLRDEDLAVFDCALAPASGSRSISWRGHVGMMAAVQPFLSGAISKTVNLPSEATVEDIAAAYIEAWKKGLKSIAIYRDGSKAAQPLNTSREGPSKTAAITSAPANQPVTDQPPVATRNHLPDERASVTHKFNVGGYEGYVTVGLYPGGHPGEIFVRMSKEGSTISGLMDAFAMVFSMALQHGVPLKAITAKMVHTRFEPSGWTGNAEFGYATSIMDYLGKWLESRFGEGAQLELFKNHAEQAGRYKGGDPSANGLGVSPDPLLTETAGPVSAEKSLTGLLRTGDAPLCSNCGAQIVPNGSCFKCANCGGTSGCS